MDKQRLAFLNKVQKLAKEIFNADKIEISDYVDYFSVTVNFKNQEIKLKDKIINC
jgi:hypothetical protein